MAAESSVQHFKTLYFADYPSEESRRRTLTLAFGHHLDDLWRRVRPLGSADLRRILGHESFLDLQTAASRARLPVNSYCLRLLQNRLDAGDASGVLVVDPLQGTFRGGNGQPLHGWYPLLEAYSPDFVETVLRSYAWTAASVLDPFAGMGTTPIVASRLGRRAYYCELNPLFQFVTDTKARVLALSSRRALQVADTLRTLADGIPTSIHVAVPSAELLRSYSEIFGESRFFDSDTNDLVLRARSWLDTVRCAEDPLVANLALLAVLASLVPSSAVIRAGDLRYRSSSEQANRSSFLPAVEQRLIAMANDISAISLEQPQPTPTLLAEDARALGSLPSLQVECVVTSPPYLNGTNYFRNTKIELWFMRSLRSRDELASFRRAAVTAGINDVTTAKVQEVPALVARLVSELRTAAYDPRIPRMVACYFTEMAEVFVAIQRHLTPGAIVAIDIGDSVYAGIRVPTDELLVGLLNTIGLRLEDRVVLRRRLSRSRAELKQMLLVFRNGRTVRRSATRAWRSASWNSFKKRMPHRSETMAKRNWGHPLHSVCSYQGKMKPSLAASLASCFVREGDRVLDPFAGVGTIPFEAASRGAVTYSFDISPAALTIAKAKLNPPALDDALDAVRELEAYIGTEGLKPQTISSVKDVSFNGAVQDFYHPKTFKEVLLARQFFLEREGARNDFVRACLLHLLHGNRPYALSRRSHPITPFAPTGEFEYRPLIPRLRDKVLRALADPLPDRFRPGLVLLQDATSWWPKQVADLDLIITSPPFFDSTRFHLANWLRLWFAGWQASDFRIRPLDFIDYRQKTDMKVYEPVLRQARERLKAGGLLVWHLGMSRKCDMAASLTEIARPWFRVLDTFRESVRDMESHGIRDKGTVTDHQYLILG